MAKLNVNANRMELSNLKKQLDIAVRGHKLLKDKQDELMRQFIVFFKLNFELRTKIEQEMPAILKSFLLASSVMEPEMLEEAVIVPQQKMLLHVERKNIMSVNVPVFQVQDEPDQDVNDIYPYGYLWTSAELDDVLFRLNKMLPLLLELAEVEKTCELLADEIEQTRRRVNALEHRIIPNLEETIRFIVMKLDEMERSTITRLIKVKDIISR